MRDSKDYICIALDGLSAEEAFNTAIRLKNHVGLYKIGLELFVSEGPDVVKKFAENNIPVFLDLKFHDIPNTVAGAMRMATRLRVSMINIHASGGPEMISAARDAMDDEANKLGIRAPALLAVTILTSLNQENLERDLLIGASVSQAVEHYARLSKQNGADGVVASPKEIEIIRHACGADFKVVTPGIRPRDSDAGDQKRIMTPGEAVLLGADYLVIGRPILKAQDPIAAAINIADEIEGSRQRIQ